jgi:hypothetical protein
MVRKNKRLKKKAKRSLKSHRLMLQSLSLIEWILTVMALFPLRNLKQLFHDLDKVLLVAAEDEPVDSMAELPAFALKEVLVQEEDLLVALGDALNDNYTNRKRSNRS